MNVKTTVSKQWRGKEVKAAAKKVTGKTLWEVGLVIEGQAKLLCPVKTGRLAASITTAMHDRQDYPSGSGVVIHTDMIDKPPPWRWNECWVGTPVFYGPYMEFGTIRTEAQPFLRPSLALARGDTLTILEKNGRLHFKEFLRST